MAFAPRLSRRRLFCYDRNCVTRHDQFAKLHPDKKQISVGVVGYPNVGKSSIINTLKKKKVRRVWADLLVRYYNNGISRHAPKYDRLSKAELKLHEETAAYYHMRDGGSF